MGPSAEIIDIIKDPLHAEATEIFEALRVADQHVDERLRLQGEALARDEHARRVAANGGSELAQIAAAEAVAQIAGPNGEAKTFQARTERAKAEVGRFVELLEDPMSPLPEKLKQEFTIAGIALSNGDLHPVLRQYDATPGLAVFGALSTRTPHTALRLAKDAMARHQTQGRFGDTPDQMKRGREDYMTIACFSRLEQISRAPETESDRLLRRLIATGVLTATMATTSIAGPAGSVVPRAAAAVQSVGEAPRALPADYRISVVSDRPTSGRTDEPVLQELPPPSEVPAPDTTEVQPQPTGELPTGEVLQSELEALPNDPKDLAQMILDDESITYAVIDPDDPERAKHAFEHLAQTGQAPFNHDGVSGDIPADPQVLKIIMILANHGQAPIISAYSDGDHADYSLHYTEVARAFDWDFAETDEGISQGLAVRDWMFTNRDGLNLRELFYEPRGDTSQNISRGIPTTSNFNHPGHLHAGVNPPREPQPVAPSTTEAPVGPTTPEAPAPPTTADVPPPVAPIRFTEPESTHNGASTAASRIELGAPASPDELDAALRFIAAAARSAQEAQQPNVSGTGNIENLSPDVAQWNGLIEGSISDERVSHSAVASYVTLPVVQAFMTQESGGDPNIDSDQQAQGLLQQIPGTQASIAADLGITQWDPHNPTDNVLFGTFRLRQLADTYGVPDDVVETIKRVAIGYHGGPTAVEEYLAGNDPFVDDGYYGPKTYQYWNSILALAGLQ